MKRIIILAFFALATMVSCNQNQADTASSASSDNDIVYRLFPTQNIWTFIKLNTRNGQMWQVQYSIKDDNQLVTPLSLQARASGKNEKNGRFTLYSTQNMFNFILLDQLDGRTWQVQWSIEENKRMVIPIE